MLFVTNNFHKNTMPAAAAASSVNIHRLLYVGEMLLEPEVYGGRRELDKRWFGSRQLRMLRCFKLSRRRRSTASESKFAESEGKNYILCCLRETKMATCDMWLCWQAAGGGCLSWPSGCQQRLALMVADGRRGSGPQSLGIQITKTHRDHTLTD